MKNNKSLVQLIYLFTIKSKHDIVKSSVSTTYLSNIIEVLSIDYQ